MVQRKALSSFTRHYSSLSRFTRQWADKHENIYIYGGTQIQMNSTSSDTGAQLPRRREQTKLNDARLALGCSQL
jgi:hypothetical protein